MESQDREKIDLSVTPAPILRASSLALQRIRTHGLQQEGTVGMTAELRKDRKTQQLGDFGHGKPFPPLLPASDDYVVEFTDEHDPLHPHNWPLNRKYEMSGL